MLNRIKSIDAFRGFTIFLMVFYHPILWWTVESQVWMLLLVRRLFFIEASLLLFVSGISVVLSLRTRMEKVHIDSFYSKRKLLNEYYLRSIIFFLVAIVYNMITAIWVMGVGGIWSWFILFTIAVCQLIAYPLIKLPRIIRVLLTIFIIFISQPILLVLGSLKMDFPNSGWSILYHLIFNPVWEYPILPNLAFFILGTVCGEVFYQIYSIKNENLRKLQIQNKIVRRFFACGIVLMVGSIIFPILMFNDAFSYLNRYSTISTLFGIGWVLFLIALFTYMHEFKYTSEWKYKFFFYLSVYSLNLYLVHNVVALFFWQSLNIVASIIISIISTIGFWYSSKILYNNFGSKISLKSIISKVVIKPSK